MSILISVILSILACFFISKYYLCHFLKKVYSDLDNHLFEIKNIVSEFYDNITNQVNKHQ